MGEHEKKPQYEKPVLINLNELQAAAAACSRGSHLSGGTCRGNGLVASSCAATGNHPGAGGCGKGSAAANNWCSTGSNAGGARCVPGGNT